MKVGVLNAVSPPNTRQEKKERERKHDFHSEWEEDSVTTMKETCACLTATLGDLGSVAKQQSSIRRPEKM